MRTDPSIAAPALLATAREGPAIYRSNCDCSMPGSKPAGVGRGGIQLCCSVCRRQQQKAEQEVQARRLQEHKDAQLAATAQAQEQARLQEVGIHCAAQSLELAGRCVPQHSRLVLCFAALTSNQSVRDCGLAGAASSAGCPSKASAGGRISCSPAAGRQASCRSSSCSCQIDRAPPDTGRSGCSGVCSGSLVGHISCWPSVCAWATSSPQAACLQAAALRLQQQQEERKQLQRLRGIGTQKQQQAQQWWRRLTAVGPPEALVQDAAPSSFAQGQHTVDATAVLVGSRPLLPPPSIVKGQK